MSDEWLVNVTFLVSVPQDQTVHEASKLDARRFISIYAHIHDVLPVLNLIYHLRKTTNHLNNLPTVILALHPPDLAVTMTEEVVELRLEERIPHLILHLYHVGIWTRFCVLRYVTLLSG